MKKQPFYVGALVLALIALVACAAPTPVPPTPTAIPPTATPVPTPDPTAVIKSLVDALNAGNVDASMAFCADDALRTQQPPPTGQSGTWSGKEQIRSVFKGMIADHFSVELSNLKVTGDKTTYTCTFATDTYRKLGVAPLVALEEAVIEGGKIKSQKVTITPESLAKIQAATAAQAKTATPTAIPPTSAPIPPTPTPRAVSQATIRVGNLDRTYLYYVPANLPRNAPLVLVFHGYGYGAEDMRRYTGSEFETLADRNGFVVVYPNGYQRSWNECRKTTPFAAQRENIDDVGFVRALIQRFRADYGINTTQILCRRA